MSAEIATLKKPLLMDSLKMLRAEDAGGGSGGGQVSRDRKRRSEDSLKEALHGKKTKTAAKHLRKPHRRGASHKKKEEEEKRRKRRVTGTNNAPFNSTQFIMNDHVSEATKHLDSTLNVEQKPKAVEDNHDDTSVDSSILERPVRRITRARESSFSIDSDEDYYYSSPEDEEEFLNKEFIKDYDNVRTDRLIDMSKTELINEYLQMEQKIEALEKRLAASTKTKKPSNEENMAETIKRFQREIQRLETENSKLKHKNACSSSCASSCCSSSDDSESESSSGESSDDSSSSSDDEEDVQVNLAKIDKMLKMAVEAQDDTGYESGQSGLIKANNGGIEPNEEKEVSVSTVEEDIKDESCPDLISVNCITSTSP